MRRIRHVVLPVRSWHYIGLLIVSLACLTLGLVSRDREGHAGSLAGPELIHQAPHESDSCPNLNPFTKMPSCSTSVSEEILKPVNEIEVSKISPTSRRTVFSRSMSLDRSSRLSSRETKQLSGNRDLLQLERISRSKTRVSNDESANGLRESRSRIIVRSRDVRSSYDPAIRLSRSRDLSNRATDRRSAENRLLNSERRSANRFNNRRLQSTKRHELNKVAQNRIDQSMNRQVSPNRQRRTNNLHDRKSLSIERRILSDTNQQEFRAGPADRREYRDLTQNRADRQSEMRDHPSRFVEQRAIERREAERFSRRENRRRILPNRSAIVSQENLNLQTRERSLKNRRVLLARIASQKHTSQSAARDYQDNLVIPNNRRSLLRSMKRLSVNDLGRRQARSVDNERSSERKSSERKNLARSMERREMQHAGRRKLESKDRLTDQRSFDRATSQVSPENLRRERVSLSQRSQDSRGNKATREQSRSISSRSRYDLEKNANHKRQARFSRSVDRNSMDQRSRSSRNSPAERRDLTLGRRERTNRLYQFREEQGTVLQRSRETERRMSERSLERRVLERRVAPNLARLDSRSESRIDNSRSREEFRTQYRRLDSRMSYEKMVKRRSARDSQRLTGRKIDARLSERSRIEDRRLERSLESRLSRRGVLERRSTLESRRSSEQRSSGDSSRSREESRIANRRLERNLESRTSRNRILEKQTALDSTQESIDRRTDESSRLHKSRIQNRRLERNSELRNSIAMQRMERANSRTLLESRISRLSDKRSDSRNLQDIRTEKNMELRKIVPKTIEDYRLHKHSVTYDFLRQAFLVGLCTVYGLSFYGKKSFIGNNIMQQAQRFLVW